MKIEGTLRSIRKARDLLLAPSAFDHGEIRFYPDLTYHIYADYSPTRDLGNRGLPMRNLSTGTQTTAPLPRKGTFFYPSKSPPPLRFDINHWIPGIQGLRARGR